MFRNHTTCRACGYAFHGAGGNRNPGEKLIEVLDLGVQPLANAFCKKGDDQPGYAPLKVLYCPQCSLAQLSVVVDPTVLYSHYSYVTSNSDMMKAHFAKLWEDISAEQAIDGVIEIGSNTGDLLAYFKARGARRVLGIDPAKNLCLIAKEKGVPSIDEPFDREAADSADYLLNEAVDLVIARHVFCHCDGWKGFVEALKCIGGPETIYCIEVPYAPDMMKMASFDQCYHEHLSYLTLRSVKALLQGTGLHIHNVQRYAIHGGAILITLRRDESKRLPNPEICADVGQENVTLKDWQDFAARAKEQQGKLKATIEVALAQGKRVAGLGASAKSTVWISACGLTRKHIAFIADNTPQKQYTFSPGTEIPIVDEGAILRELPDYLVIWCWNFLPECLERFKLARSKGVKFLVPIPEVQIIC